MILKLLLSTQMIWTDFRKILNPNKKPKILIVFDDMIADVLSNKKLNPMETKLFIGGRKLNISLILLHNLVLLCQKILE